MKKWLKGILVALIPVALIVATYFTIFLNPTGEINIFPNSIINRNGEKKYGDINSIKLDDNTYYVFEGSFNATSDMFEIDLQFNFSNTFNLSDNSFTLFLKIDYLSNNDSIYFQAYDDNVWQELHEIDSNVLNLTQSYNKNNSSVILNDKGQINPLRIYGKTIDYKTFNIDYIGIKV